MSQAFAGQHLHNSGNHKVPSRLRHKTERPDQGMVFVNIDNKCHENDMECHQHWNSNYKKTDSGHYLMRQEAVVLNQTL